MCRVSMMLLLASISAFGYAREGKENDCSTRPPFSRMLLLNAAFQGEKQASASATNAEPSATKVQFAVRPGLLQRKYESITLCVFQGNTLVAKYPVMVGETAEVSSDGKLLTIDAARLPNAGKHWSKIDDAIAMVGFAGKKPVFLRVKGKLKPAGRKL